MTAPRDIATIVSTVGCCFVAFLSSRAILALWRRLRHRKANGYRIANGLYEDADGTATEESQAQYSTTWPRAIGIISATLGFLVAVANGVLATVPGSNGGRHLDSWLMVGAWALLELQALAVFLERRPILCFNNGLIAALSCVLIGVVLGLDHTVFCTQPADDIVMALVYTQAGLLLVDFISFLSIRRRPAVFHSGKPVDGQFTAPALSALSFGWAATMLNYARKNKKLELEDLPMASTYMRSEALQKTYNDMKGKGRLWKALAWQFRFAFAKQISFVTILSIAQFGPQFAMFKLLQLLERRSQGGQAIIEPWGWVVALGVAMIVTSLFESWLFFIVYAELGMPIRSLLSILTFSKAARRKDVKGVQKSQEKTTLEGKLVGSQEPGQNGDAPNEEGKEDGKGAQDEDETGQKSRQSTINLVGVDAKRVSDFCSYMYIFPGVVVKLAVSMTFVWNLIGWKSLLAGLAVFSLSIPLNVYTSKGYSKAQGKLMKVRDQKMVVITEALQGIRQIKFSAVESQWQQKIGAKRDEELSTQWKVFSYDMVLIGCWIFGPVMLSAVSLAVYTVLNGSLSPSVAFTTLAVLSQIEMTLSVIPELTTNALDAWVSINRIDKYLSALEKTESCTPSDRIAFKQASIAWPSDDEGGGAERFILRDLDIEFPRGELSVVSGKTGSGKSLLLAGILGEVDKLAGTIEVPRAPSIHDRFDKKATKDNWTIDSAIAFVAQVPWIENATIKDNILFGLPFDAARYQKTLQVCALEKDLEILPDGEMTDIGANGINLSGGQRWRVSFARAIYSRAGILVLDDIFSAVDAHVGRQLFEEALTGELGAGRTRILVTHHVGLCLPRTKYTVHLGDGTATHAGLVEYLQRTGDMDEILKEEDDEIEDDEEEQRAEADGKGDDLSGTALRQVASHHNAPSVKIDDGGVDIKGKVQPKKFVEDEKRETGGIKMDIYKEYIKESGGLLIWGPLLLIYLSAAAMALFQRWFVKSWTEAYKEEANALVLQYYGSPPQISFLSDYSNISFFSDYGNISTTNEPSVQSKVWYYLGVYVVISIIVVLLGTLKYSISFYASIRASRKLFRQLSHHVLRAPLRWLDTVPVGRILNRYTADFAVLDSRMAGNMGYFFYQTLEMLTITLSSFFVSPYLIVFAFLLLGNAMLVALRYLSGAREVKRLESNAKSPIFEQFGSLLAGIGTIRAFDKVDEYVGRMYDRLDGHVTSFYHLWLFNRWMGMRLSIIGAVFAVSVAIVIVGAQGIDAALAGFALTFALQYSGSIIWTLRGYANLEMDMNATERIIEYTRLPIEDQGGEPAPAAWPTAGRLEITDLVAGYAPDLPAVLKGLTFTAEAGQRVGVVGRTGAGKSSLTLTLFRFLEAREGKILVDGIDVSKITLHDLRSRLAIIPQDPVLFSGTVRSNLDAFDEHSDAELRDALQRVHLVGSTGLASRTSTLVPNAGATGQEGETSASGGATPSTTVVGDSNTNIFASLSSKISEGGLNLSQGQRQLLCLARAIVSRPKLMVLDEATSAVDMGTDELIQRSIREEFGGSTLLVIAHRLSTIADFDRILVMSEGVAVEFGSPRELMLKEGGVFKGMVEGSGERRALEQMILSDR